MCLQKVGRLQQFASLHMKKESPSIATATLSAQGRRRRAMPPPPRVLCPTVMPLPFPTCQRCRRLVVAARPHIDKEVVVHHRHHRRGGGHPCKGDIESAPRAAVVKVDAQQQGHDVPRRRWWRSSKRLEAVVTKQRASPRGHVSILQTCEEREYVDLHVMRGVCILHSIAETARRQNSVKPCAFCIWGGYSNTNGTGERSRFESTNIFC
jgi:hypothetical protein